MPEEHGALKLKVPTSGDYDPGQADVPRAFREFTDSLDDTLTAASGQLLIAQPSDVAKFAAMKGDATLAADGTLIIGKEKVTNPKIGKKAVGGENVNDKAIGAGHVSDALKPSAGATAGTEALRALGTSAGTAAAGNDGRLSDQRVPTNGSVTRGKVATASLQTKRVVVPEISPGGASLITVAWGVEFASANYTVSLEVQCAELINSESLSVLGITELTSSQIRVAVRCGANVGKKLAGTLHATAWID